MKIFWKVIVAVIAFSLLGIMIVLGTAYIKRIFEWEKEGEKPGYATGDFGSFRVAGDR